MNRKKLIAIISAPCIVTLIFAVVVFMFIFNPNIKTGNKRVIIHIPEGSSYARAMDSIHSVMHITNQRVFNWLSRKKNYPLHVMPGRFVIERDISYNALINILRSGRQTPVKVTFNNIRTLEQLAGKIGKQIVADSASLMAFFSEPGNYADDGFTRENLIALFIPDTYQFFWNTSPRGFYERMLREYKRFWNSERLAKAGEKHLEPVEVAILASIIDDEVRKAEEKPMIAGVYLNRLKRGIPLQACPTIKFALNDFSVTRVLKKHLEIDSPYNTYRHRGFPPGPIGCPTIQGIEAVLEASDHDYLYFAAKADFSGYHNFSRTLAEHNRYASEYQRELNRRRIFR
jgi:UPF0755 protein